MLPYAHHPQPQVLVPTPSELLGAISPHCPPPYDNPPAVPSRPPPPSRTETQRKARQRAIAEEIGFVPTDPDTISSHEKKRHYLESLEYYVLYLHEQLRLVQVPPLALERVSTYRGLSSRSIRTLLVHAQNTNKTLHQKIVAEEQIFLNLSAEVRDAHSPGIPQRYQSTGVIPPPDYTPPYHTDFLGPDSGTYESAYMANNLPSTRGHLDDPHTPLMGIPAGYFGSL